MLDAKIFFFIARFLSLIEICHCLRLSVIIYYYHVSSLQEKCISSVFCRSALRVFATVRTADEIHLNSGYRSRGSSSTMMLPVSK